MRKAAKISLLLLRLGLGWLFFYAGITKVLDPSWSAAGFLNGATNLTSIFQWFALPQNIGWVNFLNEWGLTLVGISLILGAFVKWGSLGGILLMILYYLPVLDFPYPNAHSYIVDEHIIYILALVLLIVMKAGQYWGIDKLLKKRRR